MCCVQRRREQKYGACLVRGGQRNRNAEQQRGDAQRNLNDQHCQQEIRRKAGP